MNETTRVVPGQDRRPAVSVIIPFAGDDRDATRLLASLDTVESVLGDEFIVVDNSPRPSNDARLSQRTRVICAKQEYSSYYARNVGAECAANEWLLFLDSDCLPSPTVLDAYFAETIDRGCGAVAGELIGAVDQDSIIARYARARHHVTHTYTLRSSYKPYAVTANLLVRKAAWEEVGGFCEGIRSTGDADFCWRLQDAGWHLAYRPQASVQHRHRERLLPLARQWVRVGAGKAWLNRRYPGCFPWGGRFAQAGRCMAGVLVFALTGRFERALFKALDTIVTLSEAAGYVLSNTPRRPGTDSKYVPRSDPETTVVVVPEFPDAVGPFSAACVRDLDKTGRLLQVEADRRPMVSHARLIRGLRVFYGEDEGIARRARDVAWLLVRRPVRCAGDAVTRLRSTDDERLRSLTALAGSARRLASHRSHVLRFECPLSRHVDAARLGRLVATPYRVIPITPPGNARSETAHKNVADDRP
jgi:GT2 family glycosyltransferase